MKGEISYNLFADQISDSNGTAIYLNEQSSISIIHHCMFINCSSSSQCGGLFIDHCNIPIKFCCFTNCRALYAIAICFYGMGDTLNEFIYISTDSCSTIPKSKEGQGGTIYIKETKSKIDNLNSSNNIVNHVATIQYSLCSSSQMSFCNAYANNATKQGVIIQFLDTPINLVQKSNFILNYCGNLSLIRYYSVNNISSINTEVSDSNFIDNTSPKIVTDFINVINCYHDKMSSFGADIKNEVSLSINIQMPIIHCIYKQTKNDIFIPLNLIKISGIFLSNSF